MVNGLWVVKQDLFATDRQRIGTHKDTSYASLWERSCR